MRGIVIAWAAALATVSCNPSSSPTPEAWQAISSKALKVLLEQINGKNLKKFAPLLLGIRGPPLMMMSAATIGAASSRWIQSREQKDLRDAIKILMVFTIQREAEHIARLGTLESTSRQLVVYGPSTTAQWNSFEILEEALKDVNETVGAIKTKLDDVVQEMANQSSAVAKQHMAQMEAAAQLHTEQMAAAAQHHTEQMAAAVQHHQEQKAAAAQQMAAAAQHHQEQKAAAAQQMAAAAQHHQEQKAAAVQQMAAAAQQMAAAEQHHQEQKAAAVQQMAAAAQQMAAAEQHHQEQKAAEATAARERMEAAAQHHDDCLLLCYACAALCACAILGQMYICYDTREHMKGINKTIDKKLALMHDTIGKVKHLRHGRCARMGG